MKRYFLDLFSGIGGFALGAYWAGLRFDKHYFSEVDDYAINLYQKRFPEAIPLGDITKIYGGGCRKGIGCLPEDFHVKIYQVPERAGG